LTLYIREGVGAESSRKALFIGGREVAAKQQTFLFMVKMKDVHVLEI
jgi:hypothetical protein